MSKALRTGAMIVGAVALIATGVGAVGGTALAAKAATAIGVSSMTKLAAVASVVSTGLSAASALTAKKPTSERGGLQISFKIDPNAPIPYVVGRTAVGGTVVHRETYGTDQHYYTYFVCLSLGPIAGIDQRLVDRAPVAFSGTSAIGYYANWMWQDSLLGATPAPRALGSGIISPPFGTIPATVPGWSAAHRMSGYAATSITMLFDTKARRYQNGEPLPAWVLRGNLVWDPRLDSTWPGGVGACRRDDPATWVYSETPALHALKWRRGIFHNGKKVLGVGAPLDLIDVTSIIEAANVQEANGWKAGGELNSEMDRHEALKLIEEAGGAEPISRGALMSTLQKMPRVPVGTIRQSDIIEARSIPAMKPRRDRINGYRARFRSEAHGWEMVPIDIVQVPDYVTADGGERTGSGDYALVQDADQVASLAAYKVFDSREIGPVELDLKPRFIGYRLGDCLTVEADETGLTGKQMIVRGRRIDPNTGIVTMILESETPEKHATALGQNGNVPPVPRLTFDPDIPEAPEAADWNILGGVFQDGGYREPAVFLAGAVGNSQASNVVFEIRVAGTSEWFAPSIDPAATTQKTFRGLISNTAYEVSVSYIVRGVTGDRRILGPVTTGALEGIAGADGTNGIDGTNGQSIHIAYADSADGTVNFTTGAAGGRTFIGVYTDTNPGADSTNAADYGWTRLRGLDGTNGLPGPGGYVHIAYANNATGTLDFHLSDPTGRSYLGTYTDQTEADSTNPADYAWSLIKGADGADGVDGLPGAPGADGVTYYPYYAYANSPDGVVDFTTGAPGNRAYVGFSSGTSPTEPTLPGLYAWSPYKGPPFGLTARGNAVIAGSSIIKNGGAPAWDSDAFSTVGYRNGATASFRTTGVHNVMAGLNSDPNSEQGYISLDYAWHPRSDGFADIYENGNRVHQDLFPSYGEGVFQVDYDGASVTYLYNGIVARQVPAPPELTLYFDCSLYDPGSRLNDISFAGRGARGADGLDGTNGLPGAPGANGQTTYVHFAYADSADGTVNFTTGAAGGRFYVGVYTDFTPSDSTNPASYTWSLQRGADGANGTPGPPGANGQPSYVHIAYADSADGSVNFHLSDPTGRRYIGVYTDSNVADSTNPLLYSWSLIKGADGADGVSPFVFDSSLNGFIVGATYLGAVKAGQLPKDAVMTLKRGTTTVAPTGITVNATTGIAASHIGGGVVRLTQADADGYIDVTAFVDGVQAGAPKRIPVLRQIDPAPPESQTSVTKGFSGNITDATYPANPPWGTSILTANASGQIRGEAYVQYAINEQDRGIILAGKMSYRLSSGAAWADFGSEVVGTEAYLPGETEPNPPEVGQLAYVQTVSGLTPGQTYELGFRLRKQSGSGITAILLNPSYRAVQP